MRERRRRADENCWNTADIDGRIGIGHNDAHVFSMKYLAALLLALVTAGPAAAETHMPRRSIIVAMAQHFVQDRFMLGDMGHYHIEFDISYLIPQPQPDYWAVVGGFISDQNDINSYVAAVRLVCPEWAKVKCWRLEKLAINGEVVIDLGEPL